MIISRHPVNQSLIVEFPISKRLVINERLSNYGIVCRSNTIQFSMPDYFD
jgi:hypothetical protein